MNYAVISSLYFPIILSRRIFQHTINPVAVFAAWWLLWLLVSQIYDFGYYRISTGTFLLVVSSVHSFSIGFLIYFTKSSRLARHYPIKERVWSWLTFKHQGHILLYCVSSLVFTFILYGAYHSYGSYFPGSMAALRAEYIDTGGESVFGNVYISVLRELIIKPLIYCLLSVSLCRFLYKPYITNAFFFAFIFSFFPLFDVAAFARGQVTFGIIFIILFILFFVQRNGKVAFNFNFNLPIKRLTILVCICLLIGLFYIEKVSQDRMSAGFLKNFDSLLSYYTVPFALFEVRDSIVPTAFDGYVYSIGCVQQFVNFILRRFGLPPIGEKTMDLQPRVSIGPNKYSNAFYTWCIAFYADLGIVGVIMIPMIFGVVVAYVYKRWQRSGDSGLLALFCYLELIAIVGVNEWRLMWMDQLFVVIFLYCLFIPVKKLEVYR